VRDFDERAAAQALEAIRLRRVLGRSAGLHGDSTKGAVSKRDGGILRHGPANKADSAGRDMIQIKPRRHATA
jgi:hypothetical protein